MVRSNVAVGPRKRSYSFNVIPQSFTDHDYALYGVTFAYLWEEYLNRFCGKQSWVYADEKEYYTSLHQKPNFACRKIDSNIFPRSEQSYSLW